MATQLITRDEAVELLPNGMIRYRVNCCECGFPHQGTAHRNAWQILDAKCEQCGKMLPALENQFYGN